MTRKSDNKSLTARFGALSTEAPSPEGQSDGTAVRSPLSRVGAGIIGATRRSLADIREERDRLLELVERGAFSSLIRARSTPPLSGPAPR